MKLKNVLKPECVAINSVVTNKDEALAAIAELAIKSPLLKDLSSEKIYKALKERENLSSTGFENGIAIPHCRFSGLENFVVGLLALPSGIDFAAADGKPTELCFFIIGPEEHREAHIRLLSTICRVFTPAKVKEQLINHSEDNKLYQSLINRCPSDIAPNDQKSLVSVYIQNESAFLDILQIFSTVDADVIVSEGSGISSHLHKLPLFSTFWNSEEHEVIRIINAVIVKTLVNDTVREINVLIDKNKLHDDCLINIVNLAYSAGHLSS